MPAVGVNQATGGPAGQPDQVARVPFFLCPSEALRGFPTVFPSLMLPPHLLATDLLPSSEPAPQTALPLPSRRCGLPPPPAWSQHTRLLSKAHVQVVMCVKFEVLCIVCPGESVCGFASGVRDSSQCPPRWAAGAQPGGLAPLLASTRASHSRHAHQHLAWRVEVKASRGEKTPPEDSCGQSGQGG